MKILFWSLLIPLLCCSVNCDSCDVCDGGKMISFQMYQLQVAYSCFSCSALEVTYTLIKSISPVQNELQITCVSKYEEPVSMGCLETDTKAQCVIPNNISIHFDTNRVNSLTILGTFTNGTALHCITELNDVICFREMIFRFSKLK